MDWPLGDPASRPFPLLAALPTLDEALRALRAEPIGTMPPELLAGLADPLHAVVAAARAFVLGREMTFRVGGTEISMTIIDLDVRSTPLGLMVGQYENVGLAAERVSWRGVRLARLAVRCHNVHVRAGAPTGAPTTLVAAPVEIETTVDQDELQRWLDTRLPWLRLTIGSDAVVRVSLAARPRWGHVQVAPRMDGSAVRLVPTAVVLGNGRRVGLRRLPGWRVQLVRLPQRAMMRSVEVAPKSVSITLIVPEWREPISRKLLGKLAERLKARLRRVEVPREGDEPDATSDQPRPGPTGSG